MKGRFEIGSQTCNSSSKALASFRSSVSNPSVNHSQTGANSSRAWRSAAAGWPAELDLVRRWYEPHLQRIHDDAVLREADLLQLVQIAATYPSRERFLLDEDYLILSTIHSAKGQEWN
jgi:hypothetical protein